MDVTGSNNGSTNDYQGATVMNKILYSIILAGLLLTGITAACNLPFTPASEASIETPTPTTRPAETMTPVITPTETGVPASATPEFAPVCEPGGTGALAPSTCQLPIAEEGGAFCSKKDPYNLIFINEGATYETLNRRFYCSDAGMKDGRQMVACTGPMALPFEVKICDPSCAVPTIQAEITQCPQGFNYNNLQGCCTQEIIQLQQNCVTLKLETISCVVECGQYTKKSACNNHSYACKWDDEAKVCQLRK